MGAGRIATDKPNARILKADLIREEREFEADPQNDLISYDEVA